MGARVLVHIGPHKTGTTSVQGAFHLSRAASLAQGVRYAGPNRHPVRAAQAIVNAGNAGAAGAGRGAADGADLDLWRRLVRDVREAPERLVVVSSEWFADADDATIRRIVDDLGPGSVEVVVTVRALERLLPSQWQQHVAAGLGQAYEPWLAAVLRSDGPAAAAFWRRHRHDTLVRRWSEVVGADRVAVIVVHDSDHEAALRAFEELTGLRDGTLRPEVAFNRSLTVPELDVVRALNARLLAAGVSGDRLLGLVLYGAAAALRARTPAPGEPRVATPPWAVARARDLGREIDAGLEASGVRILRAAARPAPEARDEPPDAEVAPVPWPEIVATAALGTLTTCGLARRWPSGSDRAALASLSTRRLLEVLNGRRRAWRRDRLRRPQGRMPDAPLAGPALDAWSAFAAAARQAGASSRVIAEVRRAFVAELTVDRAPSSARSWAPDGPAEPWPSLAASLGLVIARVAGRVDPAPSGPSRRRPTLETLDVAAVATVPLALLAASRLVRRLVQG